MPQSATEKEIKKHYKRLSLKFHPDKVKLAPGETLDSAQEHFVNLTKAYKALTDETIRQNVIDYNDPDGRQQFSMGIAIPHWIVESQNSIWVLGVYGLLFGAGLPALVGRWWFGSRSYTKDGVRVETAELFFKSIREDISDSELLILLGKALANEKNILPNTAADGLQSQITGRLGANWAGNERDPKVLYTLILLYAHLLRIPVDGMLLTDQASLLLHTQTLLSSLLNITLAHSWLTTAIRVMRLHAFIVQGVASDSNSVLQFPSITEDPKTLPDSLEGLVEHLDAKGDSRVEDVKKIGESWPRLEVVDATYKVIGERLVTPGAIVQLIFKLRVCPPFASLIQSNGASNERRESKIDAELDQAFLTDKKDFEDLPAGERLSGWVHAPLWPSDRKPRWWAILSDDKTNKVVVPPLQVYDIPLVDSGKPRNYRSFKFQFQAPQGVGLYTWRLRFISDSIVGEEIVRDLTLKVDDLSLLTADEQHKDDQISDPEEDTLAGQMAMMRGGSVKRIPEDSDGSSTDVETDSGGSSSDSD
ncbi:hypothetical protein Clacol_002016 [Clathrus columnatus]|uniref:J domain-containing protein n=1 Tax=Clathrus columnatus TaxID=1419009 RepID=A0AAV5A454_9AGAM|nr:hypothetical protein Clacol_002016 [Clathrus columnatus]